MFVVILTESGECFAGVETADTLLGVYGPYGTREEAREAFRSYDSSWNIYADIQEVAQDVPIYTKN